MPRAWRGARSLLRSKKCMVRNSVKYVPWKDYEAVTADLQRIYPSTTKEEALSRLNNWANAGMRNTRRSAEAGMRTGTTCGPCFNIRRISVVRFIRPAPLNRSIVLFGRRLKSGSSFLLMIWLRKLSTMAMYGCFKKVDYAYSKLEGGIESFYDCVWRALERISVNRAVTQNDLQAPNLK